jgi:hypothetical protein
VILSPTRDSGVGLNFFGSPKTSLQGYECSIEALSLDCLCPCKWGRRIQLDCQLFANCLLPPNPVCCAGRKTYSLGSLWGSNRIAQLRIRHSANMRHDVLLNISTSVAHEPSDFYISQMYPSEAPLLERSGGYSKDARHFPLAQKIRVLHDALTSLMCLMSRDLCSRQLRSPSLCMLLMLRSTATIDS